MLTFCKQYNNYWYIRNKNVTHDVYRVAKKLLLQFECKYEMVKYELVAHLFSYFYFQKCKRQYIV